MRLVARFFALLAASFLLAACGGGDGGGGDNASIPIAHAGAAQSVLVDSLVILNGSASADPGQNALSYVWTLVSRPDSSAATLSNANTAIPTFTADMAGDYVVSLVVNNGTHDSAAATVTITATSSTTGLLLSSRNMERGTSTPESWPYAQTRQLVVLARNRVSAGCNDFTIPEIKTSDCPGSLAFSLFAQDQGYTIVNLQVEKTDNALTQNPSSYFEFSSLENGRKIAKGERINFYARFGLNDVNFSDEELSALLKQIEVVYSFSIAETGQTFRQVLHFTSGELQLYSVDDKGDSKLLPWPYDQSHQSKVLDQKHGGCEKISGGFVGTPYCTGFLKFSLQAVGRDYTIQNLNVFMPSDLLAQNSGGSISDFYNGSKIVDGHKSEFFVEYYLYEIDESRLNQAEIIFSFDILETGDSFRQVVHITR